MMPLGAPSISKYGSLVRPDAQIVALRAHCTRTARALRLRLPQRGRGYKFSDSATQVHGAAQHKPQMPVDEGSAPPSSIVQNSDGTHASLCLGMGPLNHNVGSPASLTVRQVHAGESATQVTFQMMGVTGP